MRREKIWVPCTPRPLDEASIPTDTKCPRTHLTGIPRIASGGRAPSVFPAILSPIPKSASTLSARRRGNPALAGPYRCGTASRSRAADEWMAMGRLGRGGRICGGATACRAGRPRAAVSSFPRHRRRPEKGREGPGTLFRNGAGKGLVTVGGGDTIMQRARDDPAMADLRRGRKAVRDFLIRAGSDVKTTRGTEP